MASGAWSLLIEILSENKEGRKKSHLGHKAFTDISLLPSPTPPSFQQLELI